MKYQYIAIADSEVPRAPNPIFQHLLDTYASETNKVVTMWRGFAPEDLDYRPHEKCSTVRDILKHQLLAERRFFGEFVGPPEPAGGEGLPSSLTVDTWVEQLTALARPRLQFLA